MQSYWGGGGESFTNFHIYIHKCLNMPTLGMANNDTKTKNDGSFIRKSE